MEKKKIYFLLEQQPLSLLPENIGYSYTLAEGVIKVA